MDKKQVQKEEQDGEEVGTASAQSQAVHSLAEGVGDAVDTLRNRVDSVVKEVDKALRIPHFTETQYANLHCPERVEKVKDNTEAVDHGKIRRNYSYCIYSITLFYQVSIMCSITSQCDICFTLVHILGIA